MKRLGTNGTLRSLRPGAHAMYRHVDPVHACTHRSVGIPDRLNPLERKLLAHTVKSL